MRHRNRSRRGVCLMRTNDLDTARRRRRSRVPSGFRCVADVMGTLTWQWVPSPPALLLRVTWTPRGASSVTTTTALFPSTPCRLTNPARAKPRSSLRPNSQPTEGFTASAGTGTALTVRPPRNPSRSRTGKSRDGKASPCACTTLVSPARKVFPIYRIPPH